MQSITGSKVLSSDKQYSLGALSFADSLLMPTQAKIISKAFLAVGGLSRYFSMKTLSKKNTLPLKEFDAFKVKPGFLIYNRKSTDEPENQKLYPVSNWREH